MKVVAAIPVKGRHPLLKYTIKRLLTKCGVSKVICVGDKEDRAACEEFGADYVVFTNYPLGLKWNIGFQATKEHDPDAVLFVGSSDWVSDDWCSTMFPYLETHYMAGKLGCHLLDIREGFYRCVYWPGYKDGMRRLDARRHNEPIGIGRMLSREFLQRIKYTPFDNNQDNSLDWTMYQKAGSSVKVSDDNVYSMAISTDRWVNKHKFNEHWAGRLPSEKVKISFCDEHFPEYKLV
jgi:hypothetical protein